MQGTEGYNVYVINVLLYLVEFEITKKKKKKKEPADEETIFPLTVISFLK